MKRDAQIAANSFANLFPKEQIVNVQHQEFKPENDVDVIFTHLRFAEMIHPEGGIMLCPISHMKSRYIGINCERIFGHPHEALMKMSLADFFEFVHPEDILPVQQCLKFIKTFAPWDPVKYRFVTRYRFRNSQGEYLYIKEEKLAIKTSNNSYLYLLLFSNITNEAKYYHVVMDIFRQVNGKYVKTSTYNPKQKEKSITPRQNDIAKLILKGFTNQEIADYLSVSVFTVKNHKKVLFKKINVKNSIDFANYVRQTVG